MKLGLGLPRIFVCLRAQSFQDAEPEFEFEMSKTGRHAILETWQVTGTTLASPSRAELTMDKHSVVINIELDGIGMQRRAESTFCPIYCIRPRKMQLGLASTSVPTPARGILLKTIVSDVAPSICSALAVFEADIEVMETCCMGAVRADKLGD